MSLSLASQVFVAPNLTFALAASAFDDEDPTEARAGRYRTSSTDPLCELELKNMATSVTSMAREKNPARGG